MHRGQWSSSWRGPCITVEAEPLQARRAPRLASPRTFSLLQRQSLDVLQQSLFLKDGPGLKCNHAATPTPIMRPMSVQFLANHVWRISELTTLLGELDVMKGLRTRQLKNWV